MPDFHSQLLVPIDKNLRDDLNPLTSLLIAAWEDASSKPLRQYHVAGELQGFVPVKCVICDTYSLDDDHDEEQYITDLYAAKSALSEAAHFGAHLRYEAGCSHFVVTFYGK